MLARILVVAVNARVGTHLRAHNEIVQDLDPRVVTRQVVIELGRNLSHLAESVAGYVGEVVVLVVVAHVEGDQIERAVVRVGLVALDEHVVLGDEVARDGVETEAEHGADEQVENGLRSPEVVHGIVECELNDQVDDLGNAHGLGHDQERSHRVEQGQQAHIDYLADGRGKHSRLDACWQIGIVVDHAQVFMVITVVLLEGDKRRHSHRQVGEVAEHAVGEGTMRSEHQVMRDLV